MPYSHLPTKSAGDVVTLSNYNTIKNAFAIGVPDIFTAKGDLALGTSADAAVRLAIGTDDDTLVVDSSQVAGASWQIQPAARVYNSTDEFGVESWLSLTFNSERFDTNGLHSLTANTNRLTIPVGGDGLYLIGGAAMFQVGGLMPLGGYLARIGLRILLNGVACISEKRMTVYHPTVAKSGSLALMTLYQLSSGDYVELQRYAVTANPYGVLASANFSPEFWAIWQRRA